MKKIIILFLCYFNVLIPAASNVDFIFNSPAEFRAQMVKRNMEAYRLSHPTVVKPKIIINNINQKISKRLQKNKNNQRQNAKFLCSHKQCDRKFTNTNSLKRHLLIHNSNTIQAVGDQICPYCDHYEISNNFLRHLKHNHKSYSSYLVCACKTNFKKINQLEKHLKKDHQRIISLNFLHGLALKKGEKLKTDPSGNEIVFTYLRKNISQLTSTEELTQRCTERRNRILKE